MTNHEHEWLPLKGLEEVPIRYCSCGAMKVRGVQVGENTITLSPSGIGDVVRWSATATPTALGDLGMDTTTGRPLAYIAAASRSLAHTGELSNTRVAPGYGVYSNGADGAGSFAANTTLVAGSNVMRYTTLTFTAAVYLENNTADPWFSVFTSGNLTTVANSELRVYLAGTNGTGGASAGGSGAGGNGGQSRGGLFVYANGILGTGIIHANGAVGVTGGTAVLGSSVTGNAGTAGSGATLVYNVAKTAGTPGQGTGGTNAGAAGTGGAQAAALTGPRMFWDICRYLNVSGDDTTYNRAIFRGGSGAGGGSGGGSGGANNGGGGGGGAAGAYYGIGAAGGNGGAAIGIGGGGGGGGGAGAGSCCMVVTESASACFVYSNGGTGGNGGGSNTANGGRGGGGGGGSGGVSILIANSGNSATVTASAGAGGSPSGTGNGGVAGSTGGAGLAMKLSK